MRFSAAFLATVLGAVNINAQCIDGHREVISPGYTVEYKCNFVRLGETHNGVLSEKACAEMCRDAGSSVCTYHPPTKRCVVGKDGGKEMASNGAIYMMKVDEPEIEDPFAEDEDPFSVDCEAEKQACESGQKACLEREKKLKASHAGLEAKNNSLEARIKNIMQSNCPSQHGKFGVVNNREYRFWCGRHHSPEGFKEELPEIYTMADCVDQCSRKAWCNHVLHGIHKNKCRLFESPKVSAATMPGLATGDWNCGVKK
ncbi:hypothetical protein ACKRZS_013732 [Fusarium odoratissimum]|uniref:Apple domain-containing protein n=3 Tax=Fusarium oxysporum species complex TaxID=171631 RepID=N1RJA6_FUSC4|nr:uncharacterized protein FOIG_03990 [Fusarium odoratissimum NRRL 54006]EMT65774.1 hypothetical protein FOC4_g10007885 [Fusarium odoratissimum]KAH7214597.1 hypothetical protein DER44DRAFT_740157 [Fusarium oxysporum]KAK2126220.1 hypothetical protein NOF04DRAFT_16879 [Fusarium oxysporum II5]TXB99787.1 hypothetical protein FocTR4_00014438 [Fusarium oxysporum f. sp. cubense]EXM05395.1 hypothetical protein FOIG_03990 [Fusarium odoratissimum NRRL 54006]